MWVNLKSPEARKTPPLYETIFTKMDPPNNQEKLGFVHLLYRVTRTK